MELQKLGSLSLGSCGLLAPEPGEAPEDLDSFFEPCSLDELLALLPEEIASAPGAAGGSNAPGLVVPEVAPEVAPPALPPLLPPPPPLLLPPPPSLLPLLVSPCLTVVAGSMPQPAETSGE